ncbi:rust resistance kinase Lr10-like isoform X1 [Mercurialis annua]|uniref:rust resistance kinase Lr10-like isoform X1 n=1 Tax=Mercurialis annua TaxID=3986 RepID=UPI00215FCC1F|nr:rust resistance kinase Lr10-like isoform X1 [Mercurialis annua]XP_050221738.1 rust resistance kinase Lr10-like isoform X1 [Mercurialis annua]XP_050221739.1 rust resistance kinase Lr10-like isoform X1 [Mercurialis annua]
MVKFLSLAYAPSSSPSMFWKKLIFAGNCAFAIVLLFQVPCNAQKNHNCESPSSCGDLVSIAYPFRLKGDPSNCGDPNYELTCENSRAFANLYSGKYYVKSINYSNSTIRLADVGVQDQNCSTLPLYPLNYYNFSFGDQNWVSYIKNDLIMFLSCKSRIISELYIDASPCLDGNSHQYALVGNKKASDVVDGCSVNLIVMARTTPQTISSNVSFIDVHNDLLSGFDLSWSRIYCEECKGQGYCIFDGTTDVIKCSSACSLGHISSFGCTAELFLALTLYLAYYGIFVIELILGAKIVFGAPCIFIFLIYKWRRRHLSVFDCVEEFLRSQNNLMPVRYSYSKLRKMTNGFKEKLGEGGYGSVYKGKLQSGNLVAVKILGKSNANGQEFINEVATIGRISHVNIVRLIGFCADGSKRALVYDFMPNGSLEKHTLSQENHTSLSWHRMFEISLGVARGIEYLHRGCDMQILHFDIKPHNILLDENFTPKVSDFGLAKLYPTNDMVVSMTAARGTIGYIAPELFYKNIGGVSYKADVYSFGMLLMEMTGNRKNKIITGNSSKSYFPFCVYDQVLDGKAIEIEDVTADEKKIIKKMVMIALWCIQFNPVDRPSMTEVVKMLEGESESIQLPPRLFLYPEETLVKDNTTWSLSGSTKSTSLVGNEI